jgi:hypothetical protein
VGSSIGALLGGWMYARLGLTLFSLLKKRTPAAVIENA